MINDVFFLISGECHLNVVLNGSARHRIPAIYTVNLFLPVRDNVFLNSDLFLSSECVYTYTTLLSSRARAAQTVAAKAKSLDIYVNKFPKFVMQLTTGNVNVKKWGGKPAEKMCVLNRKYAFASNVYSCNANFASHV